MYLVYVTRVPCSKYSFMKTSMQHGSSKVNVTETIYMRYLRWLPVRQRIYYKQLLFYFTHNSLNDHASPKKNHNSQACPQTTAPTKQCTWQRDMVTIRSRLLELIFGIPCQSTYGSLYHAHHLRRIHFYLELHFWNAANCTCILKGGPRFTFFLYFNTPNLVVCVQVHGNPFKYCAI